MASRPSDPLPTPFDYRLNPAFGVRFFGAALVALALVMFAATAIVAIAGWNADLLVVVLVLGLAAVFTFGWWLRNRATVLHVDAEGYRVRLVRGAGVAAASWTEVEDAATASPHGIPVVVLQLTGGRTTSIPVQALAIDREEFVRELQRRLRDGQGLRPL
ncbi:hypothetical protein GCM10022215_14150 [Nocardioides fonticola]|uniref:PH domain-containing protein n=1 Tax=Nocardioides fonticola TaxID=450363 RepID=A0ABP7XGY5_9ACTN